VLRNRLKLHAILAVVATGVIIEFTASGEDWRAIGAGLSSLAKSGFDVLGPSQASKVDPQVGL
jgi:hypothetical protein